MKIYELNQDGSQGRELPKINPNKIIELTESNRNELNVEENQETNTEKTSDLTNNTEKQPNRERKTNLQGLPPEI
jgi:hypothetical protein